MRKPKEASGHLPAGVHAKADTSQHLNSCSLETQGSSHVPQSSVAEQLLLDFRFLFKQNVGIIWFCAAGTRFEVHDND